MTSDLSERIELHLPRERRLPRFARPRINLRFNTRNISAVVGLFLLAVIVGAALFADWLAPASPWSSVARPFQPPSFEHPFGTDDLGRDVFSGVVHGARTSLFIGLTVTVASLGAGILLGSSSGYFGGLFDDLLMRFTEFIQVLPRFFLALVAVALFQPGLFTITIILALTSWPMTTRILRAEVLSARQREYVVAVRALGAGHLLILWKHILPNTLTPVIVHSSLMIGQVMLIEASLAFLGLGDPNHISWGYMLNNAQSFLRTAWWMPVFPGLALTLAVLGFNLASDGFREASAG